MNKALKNKILYWLRGASDMGSRGFPYSEEESCEDWKSFENIAMDDIECFLSNVGLEDF